MTLPEIAAELREMGATIERGGATLHTANNIDDLAQELRVLVLSEPNPPGDQ